MIAQAEVIHPSYLVEDGENRPFIEEIEEVSKTDTMQQNEQNPTSILWHLGENQPQRTIQNRAIVLLLTKMSGRMKKQADRVRRVNEI